MENIEPIKFISPSNFYFWEKCPLKAVFYRKFKNVQIFPRNPDADLGSIIHSFFENKKKWGINSTEDFERKWSEIIAEMDTKYKDSSFQNVFYPIKWFSKYYAVKKTLLKNNLFLDRSRSDESSTRKIKFEKWIDDGEDVGGIVDLIIYDGHEKIIEIVDFKTGGIYELIENNLEIKQVYKYQLALYSKIIFKSQSWFPKTYLQDIKGQKHNIDIDDSYASEVYKRAISLKKKINDSIERNEITHLAMPSQENCTFCDYRPHCISYKKEIINTFESKNIDIYCEILNTRNDSTKLLIQVLINEKVFTIKNLSSKFELTQGTKVFIYNLFIPDIEKGTLYATKNTAIYE